MTTTETPNNDPWAEVPEVGTIAYYRYIGDAEAERDLLSKLLRGMARRVGHVRRLGVAALDTSSKRWAQAAQLRPTLAETRTGLDWCPSCEHEAGTDRTSAAGGDHCASCGTRLAESPTRMTP
jgi:hypothetical protein